MNFCKNCKHSYSDTIFFHDGKFLKCNRPEVSRPDKVTGQNTMYCSTARDFEHLCGSDGKYFTKLIKPPRPSRPPRKTIWMKIKGVFNAKA